MTIRSIAAASLMAFISSAGAHADMPPAPQIPAQFLGEWNTPGSARGAGSGDARMVVSPSKIIFAESTGTIVSVRRKSPTAIDVTARYTGRRTLDAYRPFDPVCRRT